LLAGRKLLLADDSITIQKIVDLTFSDEGVSVRCVSNGQEAIEAVENFRPDVVLADVFMPEKSGYQVCEYIKHNEKLKHIQVMLLVGSFEPFDEEEARRVGADEILTKPFQSIRRLMEKVGLMAEKRKPEEQIPTAELPKPETPEPEPEKLSTAELEMTTADTQPLPPELKHVIAQAEVERRAQEVEPVEMWTETPAEAAAAVEVSAPVEVAEPEPVAESYDELLELGEVSQGGSQLDEDFVLDIDLDETPEPSPAEPAYPSFAFRKSEPAPFQPRSYAGTNGSRSATSVAEPPPANERVTGEIAQPHFEDTLPSHLPEPIAAPVATPPQATASADVNQLSPEMIDAIARRVVEQMSEKVVQEIAWEVVPQLAELLIKRQLDDKNS
jgi:CheY-like chemotaxis protein